MAHISAPGGCLVRSMGELKPVFQGKYLTHCYFAILTGLVARKACMSFRSLQKHTHTHIHTLS